MQPEARSLQPIANAPRLTAASSEAVREITILDESGVQRTIHIPAERPLTVLLDDRELVTLLTLGASAELLVLGFLSNQRLIKSAAQIESISVDWKSSTAAVKTRQPPQVIPVASVQSVARSSGRATAFATKMTQNETMRLPAVSEARIQQATLRRVIDVMRQHDSIHRLARSVHSCALFHDARLLVSVEDVSRHNALDTISGWMALHGIDGGDKVLFTTGRLTGEMVIKAAQSGVPIVLSRNGVSTMGYDLAKKFGMALFGRAVNRGFHCYVGSERLDVD